MRSVKRTPSNIAADCGRARQVPEPDQVGSEPTHGRSFPLGAVVCPGGVNFSVFSKHSSAVELLLFDHVDDPSPSRAIDLDPRTNRTYHYWHTFVPALRPGQLYGYRVDGPFDPERGIRFDGEKVLLDQYGKCVARPAGRGRAAACNPGDNAASAFKSVVVEPST